MGFAGTRVCSLLLVVTTMLMSGCLTVDDVNDDLVQPGELVTEDRRVDLGEGEDVEVYLEQGNGQLLVEGGTDRLMEASFRYNVDRWRPEVTYRQVGQVWNLSVVQPNTDLQVATGGTNEWDIALGEGIPLDLVVVMGAGDADVEIGSLDIRDLDVKVGAGDLDLDLRAYTGGNITLSIDCGVGQATIIVPVGMGVRVSPVLGVGELFATDFTAAGSDYLSPDFDGKMPHIVVQVHVGVGDLTVLRA